MALTNKLTAIADAIRLKSGKSEALTLDEMPTEIEALPTGGGGNDVINAIIDRSIREVTLDATKIGNYAFYGCTYLNSADLPNATSVGESAFHGGSSLDNANLPNATSIGAKAFYYCTSLKSVDISNATSIGNNAFYYCTSLKSVDISNATSIGNNVFCYCYRLTAVILRSETVCTLGSTVFNNCYHMLGIADSFYNPNGYKDGYIYVPLALVETYRAATNWSAYASLIMPYVATLAELASINETVYDKAYVGETEKEYTHNGSGWEEYTR